MIPLFLSIFLIFIFPAEASPPEFRHLKTKNSVLLECQAPNLATLRVDALGAIHLVFVRSERRYECTLSPIHVESNSRSRPQSISLFLEVSHCTPEMSDAQIAEFSKRIELEVTGAENPLFLFALERPLKCLTEKYNRVLFRDYLQRRHR